MNPKASRTGLDALANGTLSQSATDLLLLCDGTRDLAALEGEISCSRSELLERMDALADAGLLAARAAPPTGVSRRGILGSVLGGAAALAVAAVARKADAAPAASLEKPLACFEAGGLDLDLELPVEAGVTGLDPAPLLKTALVLQAGTLDAEIASADVAQEEEAAALLAELADAYASLTSELAVEGLLEHSEAMSLGDFGPLGREGDLFTGVQQRVLADREQRAKQRHKEVYFKQQLSAHDEEQLKLVDTGIADREAQEKAMTYPKKLGASEKEEKAQQQYAYEYAHSAYKQLAAQKRKKREYEEENKKQSSNYRVVAEKSNERAVKARDRYQAATKQLLEVGTQLDQRSLDSSLAWSLADLSEARRISERDKKAKVRKEQYRTAASNTSPNLAKLADEMLQKQQIEQAKLLKKKALEASKKAMQQTKI